MKKVVTIGGGTGRFALLQGLKKHPVDISAIVTMADDGGSTGRLRDEFGVLPPGDVRQCLVALSENRKVMRELFNHRFSNGGLGGHSFGNIFISTLEMVTGSMEKALEVAGQILNIKGHVIPVTFDKVTLVAELKDGTQISGEDALGNSDKVSSVGIRNMTLKPRAKANPKALDAIRSADLVIVGPGDLYTSLIPNFLVQEVGRAMKASKATKVLVVNLMNKRGHADNFSVADYVRVLEECIGARHVFDIVIYNTKKPAPMLLKKYAKEGEPVSPSPELSKEYDIIGADVLAQGIAHAAKGDTLDRAFIRHDPDKLARVLLALLKRTG
jgi:uncharacterized cofD-like protein